MTTTIIIVAVYLVGCVLAYGKAMAVIYEMDERFMARVLRNISKIRKIDNQILLICFILSYIGFILSLYSSKKLRYNKYWFKWSKKELWKKYYENQK